MCNYHPPPLTHNISFSIFLQSESGDDQTLFYCDFSNGLCGFENRPDQRLEWKVVHYVMFGPYKDRHGEVSDFLAEGSYQKVRIFHPFP